MIQHTISHNGHSALIDNREVYCWRIEVDGKEYPVRALFLADALDIARNEMSTPSLGTRLVKSAVEALAIVRQS